MTIMPGTISLAHNLKFKLIAQGVETDLHRLLSGCSPLGGVDIPTVNQKKQPKMKCSDGIGQSSQSQTTSASIYGSYANLPWGLRRQSGPRCGGGLGRHQMLRRQIYLVWNG